MRPSPRPGASSGCEAARLRASLALDGALEDDFDLLLLERHLTRCPECAAVVAGMRAAARAVRHGPLEPYRCELRVRGREARRLPWANIAVAVVTLAVGASILPHASDPPGSRDGAPRLAAPPPHLPIGQRLAGDDFARRPAGLASAGTHS